MNAKHSPIKPSAGIGAKSAKKKETSRSNNNLHVKQKSSHK